MNPNVLVGADGAGEQDEKGMNMSKTRPMPPARVAMLRWTAHIGAITAEALAAREGGSVASARSRLLVAVRAGMLMRQRPLVGQPALYTITRAGLRACGPRRLDPCRVTPSNAMHLIVCAEVAATLEGCYPDHRVLGERELRRDERECGAVLASALMSAASFGRPLLHRPDLVLWPRDRDDQLPVAVEVELTVKGPRRLADICLAWARCRCVAGVLYLVAPEVEGALARAVARSNAGERVVVVPLDALPRERAVGME
ncbi:MAG: hypothetical protein ACLQMH_01930 [Solirubrobacteraceae bacterium]